MKLNRKFKAALAVLGLAGTALVPAVAPTTAGAVSSATFTTNSTGVYVNANTQYQDKCEVYVDGGPPNAELGDGDYTFAVIQPGGNNDINGDKLLSNDSTVNRTFTMSGGVMTYTGTHATSIAVGTGKTLLQLCLPSATAQGYADTPNPGGVYIAAICRVGSPWPAACKFDMFKVKSGPVVGTDLVALKTADPSFTRTFTYGVAKNVDKTYYAASAGTATFTYNVGVTKSSGVDSNFVLSGTVQVFNPNTNTVTGVAVTDNVGGFADETCNVTGGSTSIAAGSSAIFDYSCTLPTANAASAGDNVATVTWTKTSVNSPNASTTATASYNFANASITAVGDCTAVTDTLDGVVTNLGNTCSSTSYIYSRNFSLPSAGCVTHNNTAAVTGATASQAVTVCRTNTGGFTIGFWQNKNGQRQITNNGTLLCSNLANYGNVLTLPNPCNGTTLASTVYNIIKAADASGDGVAMFRAQFLATAINASFNGVGNVKVVVPGSLLGTGNCVSVNALLAAANTRFPTLSQSKGDLMAVKDTFDAFNNNNLLTCS